MTDTPPDITPPIPPSVPPRPVAAAQFLVRVTAPFASFDTGVEGVPLITQVPTPVPAALIDDVRHAAAANHITITEG